MIVSRSFSRIVWKEYRAQRTLWIALYLGAVLLQLLFLILSPETQKSLPQYPYTIAAVLSVCYAVSCGAMLFAGEREEETDRLLQTLAVAPRQLITGKLTYAVPSLALFTLLAFVTAAGVMAIHHGTFRIPPIQDSNESLSVYLFSIPVGLAAALLSSLLTRTVLSALVGGVVFLLLISSLVHNLFRSGHEWMDVLSATTLLLVSLPMVSPWLRGGPDWSKMLALLQRASSEKSGTGFLGSLLQRAAVRSSLESRMFGVLVWRELRAAFPVPLAGLVVNSGLIPALILSEKEWNQSTFLGSWVALSVMTSWFLLCSVGLLAFTGDQYRGRMKFYTDRGASPWSIWLAKQMVWLGVLATLAILTAFLIYLLNRGSPPLQYLNRRGTPLEPTWPDTIQLYASCLLMTYACVQLFAMWFRRTLLAAAFAFVACGLIFPFHYALGALRIPLWLSSGPIIVAGLAGSYFTLEGWLKETRTWRRIGAQVAWVFVPIFISGTAIFIWRIVEVPWVDPGFDWRAHEKQMANFDSKWTAQWQELIHDAKLPKAERAALRPTFLEKAQRVADRIQEGSPPRIDPQIMLNVHDGIYTIGPTIFVEYIDGMIGAETSSLEEQWENLRTYLAIVSYTTQHGLTMNDMLANGPRLNHLNRHLRLWAQDDRQTPELLEKMLADVGKRQKLVAFYDPADDYVIKRQAIEGRGWGREWARHRQPVLNTLTEKFPFSLLLCERLRLLRLQNWKTYWTYGGNAWPWQDWTARVNAWERTSLYDGYPFDLTEENLKQGFDRQLEDQWATVTLARLEKYRLVHGAYPEWLYELEQDGRIPWADNLSGQYRYEPHGLPLPLVVAPDFVLPAGQPVLFRDTVLSTEIPPLFTESERQARMKTFTSAMTLERMEAQTQEVLSAAIKNSTGGQRVLWADGWDQYRRDARHGANPEVIDTLKHIPPKTGHVEYMRIGVGDLTPRIGPEEGK